MNEFLVELLELLRKYNVELISCADAADDTNLSSWIEIVQIGTNKYGRRTEELIARMDDCDHYSIVKLMKER